MVALPLGPACSEDELSDGTDSVSDPERLAALNRTGLLDSPPDDAFDQIVRLAAEITGAPIGLLSLVDEDRQFFKSMVNTGTSKLPPGRETPLPLSLCRHAVDQAAPLILEDIKSHDFFGSHPAIRELGIAAYAGMPINLDEGHVIGTLCVIDSVPHPWTSEQIESLRSLADETARMIARKMRETDAAIEKTLGDPSFSSVEPISPADRLAAAAAFFVSKHDAYVDGLRSGDKISAATLPLEEQRQGEVVSARASLLRAVEVFYEHEPPTSAGSTQPSTMVLRDRVAEFLAADREQRRTMLGFQRGTLPLERVRTAAASTALALDGLRLAVRSYEDTC